MAQIEKTEPIEVLPEKGFADRAAPCGQTGKVPPPQQAPRLTAAQEGYSGDPRGHTPEQLYRLTGVHI